MRYHVYVLANAQWATYVGQTNDLEGRIAQHNDPACKLSTHTKRRKGPWRLLYCKTCQSRSEAIKRERQLKTGAGRRFIHELLGKPGS